MDGTLLPVLSALGGVVVTGTIAELRRWLDVRRDDRRLLRRVLHRQLQLWRSVRLTNTDSLLSFLGPVLSRQFGIPAADVEKNLGDPVLRRFFGTLLQRFVPTDIVDQYSLVIEQAADADPILAYELSAQKYLAQYSEHWKSAVDSLNNAATISQADRQQLLAVAPILDEVVQARTRKALEQDMREVARALGRRALRRLNRAISSVDTQLNSEDELLLAQTLRKLGPPFVSHSSPLDERPADTAAC